jgi:hypothetical protein
MRLRMYLVLLSFHGSLVLIVFSITTPDGKLSLEGSNPSGLAPFVQAAHDNVRSYILFIPHTELIEISRGSKLLLASEAGLDLGTSLPQSALPRIVPLSSRPSPTLRLSTTSMVWTWIGNILTVKGTWYDCPSAVARSLSTPQNWLQRHLSRRHRQPFSFPPRTP